jgi:radical SAM superfamily enzyme YgiQ (UPF0313 family)
MEKFNAVICMFHSSYVHSALAPWYLLEGVKALGREDIATEVVEGTVNMEMEAAAGLIVPKAPDAIGLSCYIWNITFIKKLLPIVKAVLPEAVVILGGPEVSYNAGDVLDTLPLVDYVISGEGEKPFALLLDALADGRAAEGIPGVCYRADGTPVVTAPHCPPDIPPSPYSAAYFKSLGGRIAYLETSRGCPYSCAFCLSGLDTGVRFFPMERAKSELVLLAGSGTQTVKLVDRTFNADRSRAREILKFIIDSYGTLIPTGVRFHFEIAGDLLDEDTLALLKTAPPGLLQFEIGLQSFHAETLDALNRKTDTGRLKRNIERLMSFGNIHVHVDLIAGLPHENIDCFAESFNTAYALGPHRLQLGFLKLLHGSEMREDPDRFPCRYSDEPPYTVTATPWLTAEELDRLRDAEAVLDRLYNSGRFRRTLSYVLARTGKTPFELIWDAGRVLAGEIRNGKLPKTLRVRDQQLKCFAGEQEKVRKDGNVPIRKYGCALLYSENAFVRADYGKKDPVTGEFPLLKHPMA